MKLRDYQLESVKAIYDYFGQGGRGNPLVVMPTGCHAPGTRVVLHGGTTKRVEDVRVGDRLLGPDGAPRTVLRVMSGFEPMYRVTPGKGEPFTVNENHVLSLLTTSEGKQWPSSARAGRQEFITVKEYLAKSKSWKHLRKLHRSRAIEFSAKPAPPLDPWALGALLGDGSIISGVKFINPDVDVLNKLLGVMREHGLDFSRKSTVARRAKNVDCWHVSFVDPEATRARPNRVAKILDDLGLLGKTAEHKHVPHVYKTGGLNTRRAVLAGLLDTDGHLSGGGYDFISKSRQLAEDVVFMARSLGLAATIRSVEKRCQNGGGGTYWRVCLSGDVSTLPLCLERKRAPERRQKKNPLVTGFDIEPVGAGPFFGFELDGDHLYLTDDFIVHHNSGKSVVIAAFVRGVLTTWPKQRIVIATHVKELIAQNHDKLTTLWPDAPAGIYSAGLRRREAEDRISFVGIQSVYNKAHEFGRIDLLLVDEAHLIPKGGNGMYRRFIEEARRFNPALKVIGFTATPFRLKSGYLHAGDDRLFTDVCYDTDIVRLIDAGYLSPLVPKQMDAQIDTTGVGTRNGEFIPGELQEAADKAELTQRALDEVFHFGADRKSWLFFCTGVKHADHVAEALRDRGVSAAVVTGETPREERDEILRAFKAGELRAVTNCDVLTTGFDAPGLDLIVMLRPTQSPGLYVQIMGRGMRIAPDKKNCLVLDFAGNVMRHGPINMVEVRERRGTGKAPVKKCPACSTLVHTAVRECPECGYQWPEIEIIRHEATAGTLDIIARDRPVNQARIEVKHMEARRHTKPGSPPMLRVDFYDCPPAGIPPYQFPVGQRVTAWVLLEHSGYPGKKAGAWWWHMSGMPAPATVDEALERLDELRTPRAVWAKKEGKYWEITDYEFAAREDVIPGDRAVGDVDPRSRASP